MILGPSWFTAIGAVAVALAVGSAGGVVKGHSLGEASVQAKWDAQALKDREAIDNANIAAQAAGELYEEAKAKRAVRVVTVIREVDHALEAAPAWASVPIDPGVRDAIAAAGAALAASEPDGAVRVPASGGADERPVGAGLHPGAASAGGMLGATSSPG